MCQHYNPEIFASLRCTGEVGKDVMIFQKKTVVIDNIIIQLLLTCILQMQCGDGKCVFLSSNPQKRDRIWQSCLLITRA